VTPLVVRMVREQFHRDVEGRPIREGRTPDEGAVLIVAELVRHEVQ